MTKIVGQQAAVTTIQNALEHERNHHAWIFQGPAGVGKFAVAQEFARALITNEIQGVFQVDREEFQHPDFHVIRKEDAAWSKNPSLVRRKQTNIPVALIREWMNGGIVNLGTQYIPRESTCSKLQNDTYLISVACFTPSYPFLGKFER